MPLAWAYIMKNDNLQVRHANWKDVDLLWHWANDPIVRENSFHPDPIPMDEHIKWFKDKMNSTDTLFLIIEHDQKPVAQIRYDLVDNNEAEINFSVASEHRGKGFGTKTLKLTSSIACEELGIERIKGIVFSSNDASNRVFIKAGFKKVGREQIFGKPCYVFLKKCTGKMGESL